MKTVKTEPGVAKYLPAITSGPGLPTRLEWENFLHFGAGMERKEGFPLQNSGIQLKMGRKSILRPPEASRHQNANKVALNPQELQMRGVLK